MTTSTSEPITAVEMLRLVAEIVGRLARGDAMSGSKRSDRFDEAVTPGWMCAACSAPVLLADAREHFDLCRAGYLAEPDDDETETS